MTSKLWKVLAMVLAIGVVAAACGSDDVEETVATTTAAPATRSHGVGAASRNAHAIRTPKIGVENAKTLSRAAGCRFSNWD